MLALVRHGQSEWNKLDKFTGWTDVGLTNTGKEQARNSAKFIQKYHPSKEFDVAYCSFLKRSIETCWIMLLELDLCWLEVVKDWRLNERHYGSFQGENMTECLENNEKYNIKDLKMIPPLLKLDDERHPLKLYRYRALDEHEKKEIPSSESFEMTIERVSKYFREVIWKKLKEGKKVLVAAHLNSIRGIIKCIEEIELEEVIKIYVPNEVPLVYNFEVVKYNIKVSKIEKRSKSVFPSEKYGFAYLYDKEEELRRIINKVEY